MAARIMGVVTDGQVLSHLLAGYGLAIVAVWAERARRALEHAERAGGDEPWR